VVRNAIRASVERSRGQVGLIPNNRFQRTGTLKVGRASKVLFRSVVLRKSGPVAEPGVRFLPHEMRERKEKREQMAKRVSGCVVSHFGILQKKWLLVVRNAIWASVVRLPGQVRLKPNNRLQWTGTLKAGEASKVLFRSAVLRKEFRPTEPGVRPL
jgi:hypothetical protein